MAGIHTFIPVLEALFAECSEEFAIEFKKVLRAYTHRSNISHPHLQDSWEVTAEFAGVQVDTDVEYASFCEDGTWKMESHDMLKQTIDEVDSILEKAARMAGIA
jgi:hypothetical protein